MFVVENFLSFIFWLTSISILIRLILMCGKYPRVIMTYLHIDVINLVISLVVFTWAFYLKNPVV